MSRSFWGAALGAGLVLVAAMTAAATQDQQRGTVTGIVTDSSTQQPVRGARVSVQSSAFSAIADTAGRYTISGLTPGRITLIVQRTGFIAEAFGGIQINAGQTTTRNLALRQANQRAFRFIPIAPGPVASSN